MPNVVGKTFDQAVALLKANRLGAERFDEFSETVAADKVIRSEPATGAEAARDSAVKVVVSKGRDLVEIPDFVGKTIQEATALAATAGVQVQATGVVGGKHTVRAQDVDKDKQVKRGTIVTIFF